jgi:hypothetical protein
MIEKMVTPVTAMPSTQIAITVDSGFGVVEPSPLTNTIPVMTTAKHQMRAATATTHFSAFSRRCRNWARMSHEAEMGFVPLQVPSAAFDHQVATTINISAARPLNTITTHPNARSDSNGFHGNYHENRFPT